MEEAATILENPWQPRWAGLQTTQPEPWATTRPVTIAAVLRPFRAVSATSLGGSTVLATTPSSGLPLRMVRAIGTGNWPTTTTECTGSATTAGTVSRPGVYRTRGLCAGGLVFIFGALPPPAKRAARRGWVWV